MRNPSLDGLRGLAFAMVLAAHFSNHYSGPLKGIGKPGVWIFFVLSAFLLTRGLLREGETPTKLSNIWRYILARCKRIVPLYWLTLVIYLPFGYVVTSQNFIPHFFFQEGAGHLWTIAAEVRFYLILPILACTHLMVGRINRNLPLLFWFSAWVLSILYAQTDSIPIENSALTPYLSVFIAGCAAAAVSDRLTDYRTMLAILACVSIAFLLITIPTVWSLAIEPVKSTYFYNWQHAYGAMSAFLLLGVLHFRPLQRAFNLKLLRVMGRVSYSGYLIHPLALYLTSGLSKQLGTLTAIFVSALTVCLATGVMYLFVEKPISKIQLPTARKIRPQPT